MDSDPAKGFLKCPLCKTTIAHRLLEVAMLPLLRLQMEVKTRALVRLRSEGMDKDQELTDPSSRYYKDPASYALDRFAFYECFKCKVLQSFLNCPSASFS